MKITMGPLPTYGDLMTLTDFMDDVKAGYFIDYDGHGNYATETEMSNKRIYPSDVKKGDVETERFTHVVWFNR